MILLLAMAVPAFAQEDVPPVAPEEAPAEDDPYSRIDEYSLLNERGEVVGDGHIFLEPHREVSETEPATKPYYAKSIRLNLTRESATIQYDVEATIDTGALRRMEYSRTVNGEEAEYMLVKLEGQDLHYTVRKGEASDNAIIKLTANLPEMACINQDVALKNRWSPADFRYIRFNPITKIVDELTYKLAPFTGQDSHVPAGTDVYELSLSMPVAADAGFCFRRVLQDAKGVIYKADIGGGVTMAYSGSSGINEPQAESDWFDLRDTDEKKIGYARISVKATSLGQEEALEIGESVWMIYGGKTVNIENRYTFDQNLVLRAGTMELKEGSTRLYSLTLKQENKALKFNGENFKARKKSEGNIPWTPETMALGSVTEFFRRFTAQKNQSYPFVVLTPVLTDAGDIKIQTTQIQFVAGDVAKVRFDNQDVEVVELMAAVVKDKTGAYVDNAGKIYRLPFVDQYGLVASMIKVPEEQARDFKPDQYVSYYDENNNFHFRLGFRRDPFQPLIFSGTSVAGDAKPIQPISKEEAIFNDLERRFRELEDLVARKNFQKASSELIKLEADLNQFFYWPAVKNKVSSLIKKVKELKRNNEEMVRQQLAEQAKAKVKSLAEMVNQIEAAFNSKEYEVVFRMYEQVDSALKDPLITSSDNMEIQSLTADIRKKASLFRDRAQAIKEFNDHSDEIKITGVIIGEDPQVAIINNSIIGHEGEKVFVIHDEGGAELGKVYIFKIESFGVTFDYKGEHITKGFDTLVK